MSAISRAFRWVLPFIVFSAQAEPLHWEATNGKVNLTIIGSVHVGSPSMYPLPSAIYQSLKNSDGLIIESDTSQSVTYPQSKLTAKQVLSAEQLFNLDKIITEFGMDSAEFHGMPPWSAALSLQFLQLQKLGYKSEDGVDLHLIATAQSEQVPLIPLETMQSQIDLLTTQPEDGKELLVSMIDEWDGNRKMTQCMIESWKAGDSENLEKMMQLSEMSPEMEQAFVHDRNQDWATKLSSESFLPKPDGQYVMIVGALHLIGKDNVIELLKNKGFKITQLNRSRKAECQFF